MAMPRDPNSRINLGGPPGSRVYPGKDPARKTYGSNFSTINRAGGLVDVVKDPFRTSTGALAGGAGGGSGSSSGGGSGGPGGGSGGGGSGGGSGGSFRSAAEDQGQANIAAALRAAKMNNPDVYGPLGSRTIEWKDGRPIITESLTEDQQALLDLQESLGMQSGGLAGDLYGEIPTSRDEITSAMMERMQPFLDQQRQQQQNALMIQGHNRGGSAWNATQDDIARRENDARLAAVLAGGQEQSRMIGAANALKSGAQPMIPEYQQFRGQPVQPAPLFDAQVASAGHQIALGNQALTRQQMALQDALARDQMALNEQIARANMNAYGDAARQQGLFDLVGLGFDAYNTFWG